MNYRITTRYSGYSEQTYIKFLQSRIDSISTPKQDEINAGVSNILLELDKNKVVCLFPKESFSINSTVQSIQDIVYNDFDQTLSKLYDLDVRIKAISKLLEENKIKPIRYSTKQKSIEICINHSQGNSIFNIKFDSLPFDTFSLQTENL